VYALAVAAIAGCPIFPASNPWNQRVDGLPVHPRSDAIVRAIGVDGSIHPDFGSGRYEGKPIGIPITIVKRAQKRTRVRFEHAGESDRGPYPLSFPARRQPRRIPAGPARAFAGDAPILPPGLPSESSPRA